MWGSHRPVAFRDVVRSAGFPTAVRMPVSQLVEPALGSHQAATFQDVARSAVAALAVVKT